MNTETLEIYEEVKSGINNMPFLFSTIKQDILGISYFLSVSILSKNSAKKLNIQTRQETYIPNTLSFINSPVSGEIILQPDEIKKQAKEHSKTYSEWFLYCFIHSLLHLKNEKHSAQMEKLEEKYFNKYKHLVV